MRQESVEVWYGGRKLSKDPVFGLPLTPGVNRIAVDEATLLILKGVVEEIDHKARRDSRRRM